MSVVGARFRTASAGLDLALAAGPREISHRLSRGRWLWAIRGDEFRRSRASAIDLLDSPDSVSSDAIVGGGASETDPLSSAVLLHKFGKPKTCAHRVAV